MAIILWLFLILSLFPCLILINLYYFIFSKDRGLPILAKQGFDLLLRWNFTILVVFLLSANQFCTISLIPCQKTGRTWLFCCALVCLARFVAHGYGLGFKVRLLGNGKGPKALPHCPTPTLISPKPIHIPKTPSRTHICHIPSKMKLRKICSKSAILMSFSQNQCHTQNTFPKGTTLQASFRQYS